VIREPDASSDRVLPPVFVGGTGRSGNTVVGRLLGSGSRYEVIPVETKFHVSPRGLPPFISGRTSSDEVSRALRRQWNESREQGGGLSSVVEQDVLWEALRELVTWEAENPEVENRVPPARALMEAVLYPFAHAAGKPGWVEMTPRVVLHARLMRRLFPDMKMINTIRDGRDVASSLVAMGWQPEYLQALKWWESRMARAHAELAKLPPGCAMTVCLEDLVFHRREETYERILEFLGWKDELEMHRWFIHSMTPERAHIGRWRSGLTDKQIADVDKAYGRALDRLLIKGVNLPSRVLN
jgi:hypothetical protein